MLVFQVWKAGGLLLLFASGLVKYTLHLILFLYLCLVSQSVVEFVLIQETHVVEFVKEFHKLGPAGSVKISW